MYNPVQESLENCRFVIGQVMDIEYLENGKLRMILFGFLATILSPLFAFIYLMQGVVRIVSIIVPLISLLIMLGIGLPLLTITKLFYGIYTVAYNVLLYFYKVAIVANLRQIEKHDKKREYLST